MDWHASLEMSLNWATIAMQMRQGPRRQSCMYNTYLPPTYIGSCIPLVESHHPTPCRPLVSARYPSQFGRTKRFVWLLTIYFSSPPGPAKGYVHTYICVYQSSVAKIDIRTSKEANKTRRRPLLPFRYGDNTSSRCPSSLSHRPDPRRIA